MLSKKIVRFLKSGFLVISIGFSMGISGCKGNTEEPVSSEPIEIVSEKGMDDNFINIPIDIYAEATTKNKLKDMETVRKVVERFGECGYAAVDCENRVDMTQIQNVIDFCDSVEKTRKSRSDNTPSEQSGRIFGLPFTDRKRSGSCEKMLLRIQRWDYEK